MCRASNPGSVDTKAYCTNEKSRYDWAWWKSSIFIWQFVRFFRSFFSSHHTILLALLAAGVYVCVYVLANDTSDVFVVSRKIVSIRTRAHIHTDSFAYKITRCKRTKTHRTHCVLAFETNFRSSAIIVRLCASACVSVSVRYVRMSFACSGNWWRKWKMSRRKWKQQHIATYVPTVGVAAAAAAAAAGRATYWLFDCVLAVK